MSIVERIKKQALVDGVVGVLIVVGVVLFFWISGQKLPGWDIRDKEMVLEDENRVEKEDVYIRDGGKLKLTDSELTLEAEEFEERVITLEGHASLSLERSSIVGESGSYIITLYEHEETSPTARFFESTLENCNGVYLYGRSSLKSSDSSLGTMYLRDKADVEVSGGSLALSFVSDGDVFTDLVGGSAVSRTIESKLGWSVVLEDTTINFYQIELYDEDSVSVQGSRDLELLLHTPGDLEEMFAVPADRNFGVVDGNWESGWFELSWADTTFSRMNVISSKTDEVAIEGQQVGGVMVNDSSKISVTSGTIRCAVCQVFSSGTLTIDGADFVADEGIDQVIIVSGLGNLKVKNADLSGVKLIVVGGGSVEFEQVAYDPAEVDFESEGTFIVDGIEQNVEE